MFGLDVKIAQAGSIQYNGLQLAIHFFIPVPSPVEVTSMGQARRFMERYERNDCVLTM